MNHDNLSDWLRYLESLPSGLNNKSLDRVKSVAKKIDVLDFSSKIITVAGTNGKGSCVAFLESILLSVNLSVGAYTSPHLLNYNERIRLNGKDIDDGTLCAAFTLVEHARARTILNYFEFSTLAALIIFKKQCHDVLIFEVGLGGRFDAVNILDSDISIITTISLDHTQILGDTLDAIGYEKSGVMRPFKPVICGLNMPESVYVTANSIQAKLYCLNKDFTYSEFLEDLASLRLPMVSAALALMAIKLLSEYFKISLQAIKAGLENAFLPGRWQRVMFSGKEIIFDVAHNPESAALLALNLAREKLKGGRVLAVVSMFGDKDIASTLKPLVNVVDRWYPGVLDNTRAASALQLEQCLQSNGITDFTLFSTIAESLRKAITDCQEEDKIVVFGSFYTVAEGLKTIFTL